uniref:Aquaporin 9 n=1 Tax=Chelydra serpentina TaxID=8475 RepID=A0A8C3S9F4_CHESE
LVLPKYLGTYMAHGLVFKSAHIFTNTPLPPIYLCYLYYWYYFVIYFSGGHINPAVSLAMCATGRLKWTKLPFYILAQFLGAFVGAAAVFGIYYDAFMNYSGGELIVTGSNATAHIFATYPAPHLSLISGFADQVTLLVLVVFAIFDTKNMGVPKGLEPIAIGLLILLLTCSLGMNSGCAMNPARDLSPRIFTAIAGWGFEVFTMHSQIPGLHTLSWLGTLLAMCTY